MLALVDAEGDPVARSAAPALVEFAGDRQTAVLARRDSRRVARRLGRVELLGEIGDLITAVHRRETIKISLVHRWASFDL